MRNGISYIRIITKLIALIIKTSVGYYVRSIVKCSNKSKLCSCINLFAVYFIWHWCISCASNL